MFDSVGISHDTAEALAGCSLPKSEIVTKKFDGTVYTMKAPEEWNRLTILQKNGYRAYGEGYNDMVLELVKRYNPYCSYKIAGNFIKKKGSRKVESAFFTGKGECRAPSCSGKFTIERKVESDSNLVLTFENDINHNITVPVARQIRGNSRKLEKLEYLKNTKLNPSDVYRRKLCSLPATSFAHGNRDGAGISKKTHQNIKAEAIHDINSFEVLHAELLKKQKNFIDDDQKSTLKTKSASRKIFGFLQSFMLTNDEFKAILFHEKEIRLFHDLCRKDIVYLDATGGVVRKIANFEKVFLYSLAVRHPFGETFPLPTGMYITSSHTVESVRYFILKFRESEKLLYGAGNLSQPRIIVTDNSTVLQNACLQEFNGESRTDYYNRTYRIVHGTASNRDLQLTLLLSCHTHIIGQVKRKVSKLNDSCRHFALRIIGRLINCGTLSEITEIVQNVSLVMTAKYVNDDVEKCIKFINSVINDWSGILDELISSDTEEESEVGEAGIDDDHDCKDDGYGKQNSLWHQYWNGIISNAKDGGHSDEENDGGSLNKYYMPAFYKYFQENMLKDIFRILDQTLSG